MHTTNNRQHTNRDSAQEHSSLLPSGLLPFVGREEELERVADFFRSTIATDKLALLWLQGETGIGKSRFLEHIRAELSSEENFVLYVRLYPDSATSIVQTLAAAIEGHPRLHSLLPRSASRTILSIQAAMRRIARLRPTLLIIDDIHLLEEESIYEVIDLLAGLQDEPIALICSSRPGAITAYESLHAHKTLTLEMNPLRLEDVRQLLNRCYSESAINELTLRKVYEVSHGIPLVLRAAMTDYLSRETGGLLSNLSTFPRSAFHMKAQLSINALVTCLTSRLTPEEEDAARKLSLLGEIFSQKTASLFVEGVDRLIPILIEKNILTTPLTRSNPLIEGETDDAKTPLCFTHSLLYEHLKGAAEHPWKELIALVESQAPLYSIAPLQHIATAPEKFAEQGLYVLVGMIEALADSMNRSLATPVYNGAVAQFQRYEESLNRRTQLDIRLHLLRLRLQVISFIPAHPDFNSTLEEFVEATEDPATETLALHRLAALEYSTYRRTVWWELTLKDALDEAETLGERFPALKTHYRYLKLLGTISGAMRIRPAPPILERLIATIDRLLGSEEARVRQATLEWIATPLLTVFNSPEEMERRKELAEKIRKEYGDAPRRGKLLTAWPLYLESIGQVMEARKGLEDRIVKPLRGHNLPEELGLRLLVLTADAALGRSQAGILQEAKEILEEYKSFDKDPRNTQGFVLVRSAIVANLVLIGALQRDSDWGRKTAIELCDGNDEEAKRYLRFEIAAASGDKTELHDLLEANVVPAPFRALVSCLLTVASTTLMDQALDGARRLLEEPVYRRQDLLRLYATIGLARNAIALDRLPRRSLKIEIRNAVKQGLSWCAEHELPGYMKPLLEVGKEFLNQEDYRTWNERMKEIEEKVGREIEWNGTEEEQVDSRRKLSMIGAIQVREQNGSWRRISGARVRHVLGLLTANEMNRRSMSLEEFRKFATGMETSQEAGNYLRIMISRLRRLLGEEAILNEGESAPRLNLDYIHVDLIEAAQLIEACLTAIRERNFNGAFKAVMRALRIVGEQVILPALFDEIFDSARREFEIRLRRAVLATLEMMNLPEDSDYALLLLRMAERAIPHDDELTEKLTETLRDLGRHVEALNIEQRIQESL